MTDITKALAFAKEGLKWESAHHEIDEKGHEYIWNYGTLNHFSLADIQRVLDTFLAKRYLIQINRGTSTLFKWTVIVALQDLTAKGAHSNQARADSDDLFDAILDACVTAAKMEK